MSTVSSVVNDYLGPHIFFDTEDFFYTVLPQENFFLHSRTFTSVVDDKIVDQDCDNKTL